ncbi:hypothetical protein [Spirosoma validum]|uniref:Uncharacterized protein n=1 Tax=Spirosoma validum TaxID=2771355 RepID=A0A927GHA9_9BACT|nr:hypothetical protein [Spirosoma validum]MBD2757480.1 hypothetical protein [Spirosoma validum]
MTYLTPQQTYCLRQHLRQVGTPELLMDELIDYLACQAEERMSHGLSFEQALAMIRREATALSVRHLQHTLIRQGALPRTSFWRHPARFTKREKAAFGLIQPVRSTLLIGAFLSVMLTGWLLASRGLAIPVGLVASLLCPLLLLLFLQGLRHTRSHQRTSLVRHPALREEYVRRPAPRKRALVTR